MSYHLSLSRQWPEFLPDSRGTDSINRKYPITRFKLFITHLFIFRLIFYSLKRISKERYFYIKIVKMKKLLISLKKIIN